MVFRPVAGSISNCLILGLQIILSYARSARHLLLLSDGHSSHYSPDTVRLVAKEGVILFVLSHTIQHIFCSLWTRARLLLSRATGKKSAIIMSKNPGKYVNRYSFSTIFSKAWIKCMTMQNVLAGFKVTGIYPLNKYIVKLPKQSMENLPVESGLAFIPLYSHATSRKKGNSNRQMVHTGGD